MAKLSVQGKAFAVERNVAFNSAMDTGAERTEMVFIAAGVTDSDALLAGRTAAREIVWLDADSDGVLQIAAALAGRSGVDSIHIVSHGRAGALPLGTATLSLATLDSYRSELAAIGQALRADGDILLYGCNIAGGSEGATLVNALAEATGADVAASTNATGAAALGGDWILETASGPIESVGFATETALTAYSGLLADDFADNPSTLGTISVGGSATGDIETANDRDWFAVNLLAGSVYQIDLEGSPTGQGTLSDTYFHGVYDASGAAIPNTTDDDSGAGNNSGIQFSPSATGTYYLAAGAFSTNVGTYRLSVGPWVAPLGTPGDDVLNGSVLNDLLDGLAGNDTLNGEAGDDTLYGGADNDLIRGGPGNDLLDGGAGVDMAIYSDVTSGVQINLELGTATGGGGTDTLVSIENAIGGKTQDTLIGSNDDNRLAGGAQSDTLSGGLGNDTLIGGGPDVYWSGSQYLPNIGTDGDSLAGGQGDDTYEVTVSSTQQYYSYDFGGTSGYGLQSGGQYAADQVLEHPGEGSDTVQSYVSYVLPDNVEILQLMEETFDINGTGNTLDNSLTGNSEINILDGGSGNDVLRGGGGSDSLLGGSGSDTADYADSANFVNISLLSGFASGGAGNHATGDTFSSIENLTGSNFNDLLNGDNSANVLQGRSGGDFLNGRGGSDTASYAGSNAGVNVSLSTGYAAGGHAAGDTFSSIENLTGSNFNDLLNGNNSANVLQGRSGGDFLNGRNGSDTASYAGSDAGVNVSLSTGYAAGGHATGDTFSSIENLGGSAFADILSGDASANVLTGGDGDDVLRGSGGADSLLGDSGSDTADYADSANFVNVSLLTGFASGGAGNHATGDTFSSIENLTGSNFNDLLNGDNSANVLQGRSGGDFLNGRGGSDTASYAGSNAGVNVSLSTGYAAGGHAKGDTFSSIENLTGSAYGDTLNGNNGANVLSGLGGNDLLRGRGGVDAFVFVADFGHDTVADFADGLELLDFSGNAQVNAIGDLSISTSGADALVADSFGNQITIIGQAGNIDVSDFFF